MTNMTIGQRISAERKKLGLSQEALGEKMGVSRQAISKWEADAAVPEIDKLIALSKLFGVSVGWLLGVEEAPAGQAHALTENQLQLMEEMIKKCRPQPPAKKQWVLRLAQVLCILVLAAALLLMGVRQRNMQVRLSANEAGLDALRAQVNNDLSAMESQIGAAQTAQPQSPALLADYKLEIAGVVSGDRPQAEISFSAVPNTWQEGDSAALSIRREGMATMQEACKWDGAFLTARLFLDTADGYELCLTLTHSDGTQEQQVLTDAGIQNLKQSLSITAEATSGQWTYDGSSLTLKNYQFKVSMPMAGKFYGSLAWEQVDLILMTGSGEELGRFSLITAREESDADVLASPEVWMERSEIRFVDPELPPDAGILLWLYAETNNGLTNMVPVSAWATDAAGKLRAQ